MSSFRSYRISALTGLSGKVWTEEQMREHGVVVEDRSLPTPAEYINTADLPASYDWGNMSGVSYLTKSLNQVCLDSVLRA